MPAQRSSIVSMGGTKATKPGENAGNPNAYPTSNRDIMLNHPLVMIGTSLSIGLFPNCLFFEYYHGVHSQIIHDDLHAPRNGFQVQGLIAGL